MIKMQLKVPRWYYTIFTVLLASLALAMEVNIHLFEVVTDDLEVMSMVQKKTHINAAKKRVAQGLDKM